MYKGTLYECDRCHIVYAINLYDAGVSEEQLWEKQFRQYIAALNLDLCPHCHQELLDNYEYLDIKREEMQRNEEGETFMERCKKKWEAQMNMLCGHETCPFCGSNDLQARNVWGDHKFIACRTCRAAGPVENTEEQAWEAWDSRVEAVNLGKETS